MAKILNKKTFGSILITVIILVAMTVSIANYTQAKLDRMTVDPIATISDDLVATTSVSWAHGYSSIGELCTEADLIVMGTMDGVIAESYYDAEDHKIYYVTDDDSEGLAYGRIYFTDFSFIVDRVLKGESGKTIRIHQTGAMGKHEIRDDPLFMQGEQYILFLREYEKDRYCVLGGPQGRFMIIDNDVFSMNRILPEKISLHYGLNVNDMQKEDFADYIVNQVSIQ